MAMLSKKDRTFLKDHLSHGLTAPVSLKLFTQAMSCQFCKETRQLLEEVEELSDKISLEVYDFEADREAVEQYGIKRIPATVVMGEKDYGIRFYGIPSGYEFNSLIEDITMVSSGHHGLSADSVAQLERLQEPVHMQVFVTPTCPYCPTAVQIAHALAMASDMVTADMIEAVEFPQLGNKYELFGVPKTILNETVEFEGAAPEHLVVARVLEAGGVETKADVDALFEEYEGDLETT
jgi:glutaredoxin-like protein